jgi:hypothetical protein
MSLRRWNRIRSIDDGGGGRGAAAPVSGQAKLLNAFVL